MFFFFCCGVCCFFIFLVFCCFCVGRGETLRKQNLPNRKMAKRKKRNQLLQPKLWQNVFEVHFFVAGDAVRSNNHRRESAIQWHHCCHSSIERQKPHRASLTCTTCPLCQHPLFCPLVRSFICSSERLLVRSFLTPFVRLRVHHTKDPTWWISEARIFVVFDLSSYVMTLVTMDVFPLEVWQDWPCSGATFSSSSSSSSS